MAHTVEIHMGRSEDDVLPSKLAKPGDKPVGSFPSGGVHRLGARLGRRTPAYPRGPTSPVGQDPASSRTVLASIPTLAPSEEPLACDDSRSAKAVSC